MHSTKTENEVKLKKTCLYFIQKFLSDNPFLINMQLTLLVCCEFNNETKASADVFALSGAHKLPIFLISNSRKVHGEKGARNRQIWSK